MTTVATTSRLSRPDGTPPTTAPTRRRAQARGTKTRTAMMTIPAAPTPIASMPGRNRRRGLELRGPTLPPTAPRASLTPRISTCTSSPRESVLTMMPMMPMAQPRRVRRPRKPRKCRRSPIPRLSRAPRPRRAAVVPSRRWYPSSAAPRRAKSPTPRRPPPTLPAPPPPPSPSPPSQRPPPHRRHLVPRAKRMSSRPRARPGLTRKPRTKLRSVI
mmetsp:Transcript_2518/g.7388  ORF Transcript_2518/g.7388 Transcript_2518/m.7388 type:complete len:215 (+) Transcript_2518:622-1266(+)